VQRPRRCVELHVDLRVLAMRRGVDGNNDCLHRPGIHAGNAHLVADHEPVGVAESRRDGVVAAAGGENAEPGHRPGEQRDDEEPTPRRQRCGQTCHHGHTGFPVCCWSCCSSSCRLWLSTLPLGSWLTMVAIASQWKASTRLSARGGLLAVHAPCAGCGWHELLVLCGWLNIESHSSVISAPVSDLTV